MDIKDAGERRLLQLAELDEWRLEAYDNVAMYKKRMKEFHDKKILKREFAVG